MIEDILINYNKNISAEERNNILNVDLSGSLEQVKSPIPNKDLEDILLDNKPLDNGGITAMTGFYYQMMVSVFYLDEVFQGKWDGIFLDHHQDIVLFNNKKRIVKFIQVKTKNRSYAAAHMELVNDWIPKLFLTAYNMKELRDFEISFELVSNCHFQDQKEFNISSFYPDSYGRSNKKAVKKISDKFVEKLSAIENSRDNINKFLEQAFKNFKIKHMTPQNLEAQTTINIPKTLEFEKSALGHDVINKIISEFFRACYNPKDASIQLISDKKLSKLKAYIIKCLSNDIRDIYHKKSDESILNRYFTKLKCEYSKTRLDPHFIREFEKFIDEFRGDIEKILSSSNLTMLHIISLYLEKNSGINVALDETSKTKCFKDLLSLLLFLKISIRSDLGISDDSQHLLAIQLDKFLFLILGNSDDMLEVSDIIENFKDLFTRLDVSEKLRIVNSRNISMIISGEFDDDDDEYTKVRKDELDFSVIPSSGITKLDDINNRNITDVQKDIKILYAHSDKLHKIDKNRKKYTSLQDMKNKIDSELNLHGFI